MLRYLSAGESHGKALMGILEGMPAGLKIDTGFINKELARRQSGYGRGDRMKIEKDTVDIMSGIKSQVTIASPLGLCIRNKDASIESLAPVSCPRPGHGDFAGGIKYDFNDLRCVLERASARETAIRVVIGAICKLFLRKFNISVASKVLSVGGCSKEKEIRSLIDEARKNKDTLGGIFEVIAQGLPVGLGSYVAYDRRLDARISLAVMSIPAVKAVEIGLGFGCGSRYGSQVHDAIYYSAQRGYYRKTNNAGGIEAGISNGQPVVVRACMKPIATLGNALDSVNMKSKKARKAAVERYDTCAVAAAGVVGEAAVAFELTRAFLEKFGSDTMADISRNYASYNRSRTQKH